VTDLKFDLRRLLKNKDSPRDLVFLDTDGVGPFEGIDRDVFWQHTNYHYVAHSFDIFLFTNKKNLIQQLSWADRFYDDEVPLFCFSYRSFIETAADFITSCMGIRDNYDKYADLLRSGELKISHKLGIYEEWSSFLRSNFLDTTLKAHSPTSINWDLLGTPNKLSGNTPLSNSKKDRLWAGRVANKMALLETRIDGIRPTYDFLSEYIHPNTYPSQRFLSTLEFDNGMTVQRFEESEMFLKSFQESFNSLPSPRSQLVTLILENEQKIRKIQKILKAHIKGALKSFFRKVKFKKLSARLLDSDCMCRSGRKFGKCCGKK